MNFQTVSTAQKLPTSDGLAGGYTADGTPGPLLQRALGLRRRAGRPRCVRAHRRSDGLAGTHDDHPVGQARPVADRPAQRCAGSTTARSSTRSNAAWAAAHPGAAPLVAFSVDDDAMLLWLSDRVRRGAERSSSSYLLDPHARRPTTINDPKGVFSTTVAALRADRRSTPARRPTRCSARRPATRHAPDLVGIAQHGVVYTGGVKKIAEHGGDAADDRDVPLVVVRRRRRHAGHAYRRHVQTTQIAPTILQLLGLDPRALDGVRADHTPVLPGV